MARNQRAPVVREELTTPPPKPNKSQKGTWTREAWLAKAEEKKLTMGQLAAALEWMAETGEGPYQAAKEFTELTVGKIRYAQQNGAVRRTQKDILTESEQQKLASSVIQSARNINPAKLSELSEKVVKLLRARKQYNKSRGGGKGVIALTQAEEDLLKRQPGGQVSRVWYTNTFLPNHPKVQPKKAKTEDSKRTKNQNEHVVQEHIHGDAGLNNHLTQMGIMDSETKEIDDPRRVIHGDEMPQFLDYATGAGETYLGETGSPLAVAETQNRETGTIDMYADLSGFLYGIHAILGRKHHVESMADCFEAPDWAPRFNNQIWPNEGRSTYALASTTEKGVQTGATLLARLKLLRKEIDHRNELERATGGKEIKFPICYIHVRQPLVTLRRGRHGGIVRTGGGARLRALLREVADFAIFAGTLALHSACSSTPTLTPTHARVDARPDQQGVP